MTICLYCNNKHSKEELESKDADISELKAMLEDVKKVPSPDCNDCRYLTKENCGHEHYFWNPDEPNTTKHARSTKGHCGPRAASFIKK